MAAAPAFAGNGEGGGAGEGPHAGGDAGDSGDTPRGWLTPVAHAFARDEVQLILQHPGAEELKLAAGVVTAYDALHHRVTYTTNTLPGSSGSPSPPRGDGSAPASCPRSTTPRCSTTPSGWGSPSRLTTSCGGVRPPETTND